ncbi:hypothetical protein [Desulfococcus multivorans]|uniref:Uncharacterized protein n=1 Tax=Desulfococcus multivorans DSM 2059 TaxID=1121405 RepID=S7TDC7_DESML|nr:hypothetical protein [Desulfococcus multivorans]AOY60533.1 uncharacterized protein Dmul_37650 [Desulfococcus multivorans]AQV02628.1 hypothetical protein B2D07_18835 [Desulfococcus multivorans]EPR34580.1 hypothetical protein dsmv_3281 [Desulfococcus multivorans DSM 2059]SKA24745.1 hypothetical protein SAMN02745446_03512 [Desulfococcus multivorans DSM 2059]
MSITVDNRPGNRLGSLIRTLLRRMDTPSLPYDKRIINNMPNLYRVIRKGDVVLVEGRSESISRNGCPAPPNRDAYR